MSSFTLVLPSLFRAFRSLVCSVRSHFLLCGAGADVGVGSDLQGGFLRVRGGGFIFELTEQQPNNNRTTTGTLTRLTRCGSHKCVCVTHWTETDRNFRRTWSLRSAVTTTKRFPVQYFQNKSDVSPIYRVLRPLPVCLCGINRVIVV